ALSLASWFAAQWTPEQARDDGCLNPIELYSNALWTPGPDAFIRTPGGVLRKFVPYIGRMNAPLYNTEILRLAATIPHNERLADPMGSAEKRSPVCGSRVTVDVNMDDE